jgi:hypothetical protein
LLGVGYKPRASSAVVNLGPIVAREGDLSLI